MVPTPPPAAPGGAVAPSASAVRCSPLGLLLGAGFAPGQEGVKRSALLVHSTFGRALAKKLVSLVRGWENKQRLEQRSCCRGCFDPLPVTAAGKHVPGLGSVSCSVAFAEEQLGEGRGTRGGLRGGGEVSRSLAPSGAGRASRGCRRLCQTFALQVQLVWHSAVISPGAES